MQQQQQQQEQQQQQQLQQQLQQLPGQAMGPPPAVAGGPANQLVVPAGSIDQALGLQLLSQLNGDCKLDADSSGRVYMGHLSPYTLTVIMDGEDGWLLECAAASTKPVRDSEDPDLLQALGPDWR
jgi:hypothetical protein